MDNTTPLKHNQKADPAVVQEVEAVGDSSIDTSADTQTANTGLGVSSGRAGGESAPTESGGKSAESGGPGHGQAPGGAKGTAGANATSGGPFQSQSGETTAKGV